MSAHVCLYCDSEGFRIVPCLRSDPDRIYPDCRHREFPTPSGGCGRPGCMEAVKVQICERCASRSPRVGAS